MAFVYVLRSIKDGELYIGSTRKLLEERLDRHNKGQVPSTRMRIPFMILLSESFDNFRNARKRELYLKSGSGREHLLRVLAKRAGTQVAKGGRLCKRSVLPKGRMEK